MSIITALFTLLLSPVSKPKPLRKAVQEPYDNQLFTYTVHQRKVNGIPHYVVRKSITINSVSTLYRLGMHPNFEAACKIAGVPTGTNVKVINT